MGFVVIDSRVSSTLLDPEITLILQSLNAFKLIYTKIPLKSVFTDITRGLDQELEVEQNYAKNLTQWPFEQFKTDYLRMMYTMLCTTHKEKRYFSIYLQKVQRALQEMHFCLYDVLPLTDTAKLFKSGTVTLSDVILHAES